MTIPSALQHFIRAHREELVLTVYLEATPAAPAERRQRLVLLRQQVAAAREALATASQEERDAFERAVERTMDHLPPEHSITGGPAWACFCAAGGDHLHLEAPAGVPTTVRWALGAHVVPWLRVADDGEALVLQVDRQRAWISRLDGGVLERVAALEADPVNAPGPNMGETPRHGFHGGTRGGTAADDVQRQRREATERLHGASIKRLAAMAGEGALPILVGGAPEAAAHVLRSLPTALAARAVMADHLRMEEGGNAVPLLRDALRAARLAHHRERVEALRGAAHANGRAAFDVGVAARAATHGAIAELILSDSAWQRHPREIESIVLRALADGAEVAWTDRALLDGGAEGSDGLIAGLRFPIEMDR